MNREPSVLVVMALQFVEKRNGHGVSWKESMAVGRARWKCMCGLCFGVVIVTWAWQRCFKDSLTKFFICLFCAYYVAYVGISKVYVRFLFVVTLFTIFHFITHLTTPGGHRGLPVYPSYYEKPVFSFCVSPLGGLSVLCDHSLPPPPHVAPWPSLPPCPRLFPFQPHPWPLGRLDLPPCSLVGPPVMASCQLIPRLWQPCYNLWLWWWRRTILIFMRGNCLFKK